MNPSSSAVVIAITNQKGGVGKTTSTLNLAQALVAVGHRVLVIDMDPQGNATQGVGLNLAQVQSSAAELLRNPALDDSAGIYKGPGMDLIPATPLLAAVERELVGITNGELRLAHRIKRLRQNYSFILIDNAPGFGPLMNSALNAADYVLVPVDSSFYGLTGLQKLLGEMRIIREGYNPGIEILGLFLTLFDATRMSEEILAEIRASFRDKLFETKIRRSVKLREAPAFGRTIFQHAPGSSGAEDYFALSQEIQSRLNGSKALTTTPLRLVSGTEGVAHV
jgi:chromosome partitioning protein